MSRPWILLCPSTRGIGHALTRHLLLHTPPSIPILATSRNPDLDHAKRSILSNLSLPSSDRLHLIHLDVTSEPTVRTAASHASSLFPPSTHHLHLAFALPGILHPEKSLSQIDYQKALDTYRVNVLGPLLLMKWFGGFLPRQSTELASTVDGDAVLRDDASEDRTPGAVAAGSAGGYGGEGNPVMDPTGGKEDKGAGGDGNESEILLLPRHATWVNMSARVGSVSDNKLGGWYSYRSSKAAVNSLTKSLDWELQSKSGDKAMAVGYHPGTVKTGLSKEFWGSVANDSLFEPEDAVGRMARVVMGLRRGQRGRCWDWKGTEVPP